MNEERVHSVLRNRRIMVIEDNALLAMELENLLVRHGCVVAGPVSNMRGAAALLDRETPDAAFLDLNLNGEISTPLAERLTQIGVPFLIISGYGDNRLGEPALQAAPFVSKPWSETSIISLLCESLGERE